MDKCPPFRRKNLFARTRMSIPNLIRYYADKRNFDYQTGKPLRGIGIRKIIFPLLAVLCQLSIRLDGESFSVLENRQKLTKRPVIYAVTHIGYDDPIIVALSVKKNSYMFCGDPKDLYKSIIGFVLWANGSIFLETTDKIDRHVSLE